MRSKIILLYLFIIYISFIYSNELLADDSEYKSLLSYDENLKKHEEIILMRTG